MDPATPSGKSEHGLWRRASARPRRTVVLCFAAVFSVTLVLAGRQYFLVRERELDLRAHRLELQAFALNTGIRGVMRQQAFLRGTAERLIAEQSPHLDPVTDAPLQAALDAQQHPLWSVSVPDPDAPIRGIGARELATIPPLHRDEPTLIEDLKLARLMSPLLTAQYQMSADLARTMLITATGIVVAYPALPDDRIRDMVQALAGSQLYKLAAAHPTGRDVMFDPISGRTNPRGPQLLFGSSVAYHGVVRGAIVFAIPEQIVQHSLHVGTNPNETHALIDRQGTLIASSEPSFTVREGNWLDTLAHRWPGLSLATLFRSESGMASTLENTLIYRKLQNADLVLIDYIPARVLILSIIGQFSLPFVCVWVLLGFLLWATLIVVDQLLARQLSLSAQLLELSRVDALTNLANRRRLEEDFSMLLHRRGADQRIALLMIDIDHFKRVNDTWGHAVGDEVLKHLAIVTKAVLRPQELVSRFGGEEFCVLLPNTRPPEAADIAERLRDAIEHTVCVPRGSTPKSAPRNPEIRFTVSIGVAERMADRCADLDELIRIADQRLYAAKEDGRNRVVSGGDPIAGNDGTGLVGGTR